MEDVCDDVEESGKGYLDLICAYLAFGELIFYVVGLMVTNGGGGMLTYDSTNYGPDNNEEEEDGEEEDEDNNMNEEEIMEAGLVGAPAEAVDAVVPTQKKRQFYSSAHFDLLAKNVVYFNFDLEHNGHDIIQMSFVVMDADFTVKGEFDRYVRPPADSVWEPEACASHKLKATDSCIMNARSIVDEWKDMKDEMEKYLDGGRKVGMILAWNGKGSDCSKLFEVSEVLHRGVCEMPRWVKYFGDPMCAMSYKRNKLNESKRTQDVPLGYGLGVVYEILFQERFVNGHNSLVDARAQARIFKHEHIQSHFDRTKCVTLIDDVCKYSLDYVCYTTHVAHTQSTLSSYLFLISKGVGSRRGWLSIDKSLPVQYPLVMLMAEMKPMSHREKDHTPAHRVVVKLVHPLLLHKHAH